MARHELKTVNPYFSEVWNGNKKFEVRRNDRFFAVNDILILREYDPLAATYSGRFIMCLVDYILSSFEGLAPGYVALSVTIYSLYNCPQNVSSTEIHNNDQKDAS